MTQPTEDQPNYRDPEVARFTFPALMEASKGYAPWVDDDTLARLQAVNLSEPNTATHNLNQ